MKNLIKIEDLLFKFNLRKNLFEGINLELNEGEILGIVGANGSGKSTIINLINGFLKPREGSINVLGESSHAIDRMQLNKIITISHSIDLTYFETVSEYLEFNKKFYPDYNNESEKKYLKKFNIRTNSFIAGLSTGEQKKLQIISAFSANPKIILVDEITAVLDPWSRDFFYELVLEFKNEFKTSFVIATNIVSDLNGLADKIYVLKNGHGQLVKTVEKKHFKMDEA